MNRRNLDFRMKKLHETNEFISVFLWAVLLSVVFLIARPAIGFAAIICCMFFTFYLFSDRNGAGRNSPV
jgi:hypothetical protein